MILLDPDKKFGKGLHRECFVHPDHDHLCIKVVTYGDNQETKREQHYYKLLQRRHISWELLPKFYGNIDTNLGSGALFDLIRDHDGNISNTLEHYLVDDYFTEQRANNLISTLSELKNYLLKYAIIPMKLKPKNILYQRAQAGKGKLVIIDNIGNADFIPICNYIHFLARKKIIRRWNRFMATLTL